MSEAYTLLCRESGGVRQTTLLSENRLLEYTQEEAAGESLVGALFLGRVERVLPPIKAAFVKLGLAQNGFLPIREQESFHQVNGPAPLLTGEDVLVQVKKDPKGEKGAFLTRDVILPGQYVLLMPMNRHVGVSKRIEGEEDHARARALGKKLSGGRVGVIVRHAALFARESEIRAEMDELEAQWNHLTAGAPCRKAPELLQKPVSPLKALCRDYSARHECHVIADHPLSESLPEGVTVQQVSPEEMEERWNRLQIRRQLKEALGRKVPLANGGNLMIDQREALSTVDVNSGSFVESSGGQSLPLSQNLAAVGEIARQIRLRGLSGMILIDFIDMDREDERRQVQEAMEQALGDDRVKTVVHGFTRLGILEITRKRTGETLQEMLTEPCRACGETGRAPVEWP